MDNGAIITAVILCYFIGFGMGYAWLIFHKFVDVVS